MKKGTLRNEFPATLHGNAGKSCPSTLQAGTEVRFLREAQGQFHFECRLPGRQWFRYTSDTEPQLVEESA